MPIMILQTYQTSTREWPRPVLMCTVLQEGYWIYGAAQAKHPSCREYICSCPSLFWISWQWILEEEEVLPGRRTLLSAWRNKHRYSPSCSRSLTSTICRRTVWTLITMLAPLPSKDATSSGGDALMVLFDQFTSAFILTMARMDSFD